jgi:ADP-glucose pyrophosphorylase
MCHSKTQNLQQIVSHIEQYYKANMSFLDKKSTTDCKSYRTILQE